MNVDDVIHFERHTIHDGRLRRRNGERSGGRIFHLTWGRGGEGPEEGGGVEKDQRKVVGGREDGRKGRWKEGKMG